MKRSILIPFIIIDLIIMVAVVAFVLLNSSTDSETTPPTARDADSVQSYSGVILADEVDALEFPVTPYANVVNTASDVPEGAFIAYYPAEEWTVFQCNLSLHNSIGSFTEYRVCGISDSGDEQRVLAGDDIYSAVTDGDQLYLIGDMQGHLTDCRNQIYVMDAQGSDWQTVIPTSAYTDEDFRVCSITAVTINHDGDETVVQFDSWTGREGEYITHQFALNGD